jgi:DNA-binding MarR family transcriptional regulator
MADRIFRYSAPEDSPGFLLWQVSNQWQRDQRAALKPYALTHGQFVLLANLEWLQERMEIVSQNDLAHHAGIDVMMTSDLVRKLEERGLIHRTEHPRDSRARSIRLTAEGKRFVAEVVPVVEAVDKAFFERLGADVETFVALLRKFGNVTAKGEQGD